MLSRLASLHSRRLIALRLRSLTLSPPPNPSPHIPKFNFLTPLHFSTHNNNSNNGGDDQKPPSDSWKISPQTDILEDFFGAHDADLKDEGGAGEIGSRNPGATGGESWNMGESGGDGDGGVFEDTVVRESSGGHRRSAQTGFQAWKMEEEEGKKVEDVFGLEAESGGGRVGGGEGEGEGGENKMEREMVSAAEKLQEEQDLKVLQGPNLAFGDLVAASGITDDMLDSLIALKNFEGIDGLPPLSQIEDERYEKTFRKSDRYEMELRKQEEMAKARVRKVDEKGRAYGTGRRKCSIARVWIEPGQGKFAINDKEFDVYFPMLDHRAALLRPFSETKTLGLWDVKCTVKGGGLSGQVGAIRLGISRALQNWEPGLRPPLKEAGFLTRDPRAVERKKPGKAKARKSFQWVKR